MGMTMASATEVKDVNSTQKITDNKELSTPAKYDVDKKVQSEAKTISSDADEQKEDTTKNQENKQITDKTDTTAKTITKKDTTTENTKEAIAVNFDSDDIDYLKSFNDNSQNNIGIFNDLYADVHLYDADNNPVMNGQVQVAVPHISAEESEVANVIDGVAHIKISYDQLNYSSYQDASYYYDEWYPQHAVRITLNYIPSDDTYSPSSVGNIYIHVANDFWPEALRSPSLSLVCNPSNIKPGQSSRIVGTLTFNNEPIPGFNVTVRIGSTNVATYTTDSEGKIYHDYEGSNFGTFSVRLSSAKFRGYKAVNSQTSNLVVGLAPTTLTLNLNKTTVTLGETVKVSGKLTVTETGEAIAGATVNLTYRNNYVNSTITDSEGNYEFDYTTTVRSSNNNKALMVIYGGDGVDLNATRTSKDLTVNRATTNITLSATNITVGENTTITGCLYRVFTGEPIANGVITVNITRGNTNVYRSGNINVNASGGFTISYNTTTMGEYTVTAGFAQSGDNAASKNVTRYTAYGLVTNMTIETNGPIRIGSNLTVFGTLYDVNDEIIPNTFVNVTVGDVKELNVPVDENGHYEQNFTLTENGTYEITVEYAGGANKYNASVNTTTYQLDKIPTITNVTVVNNTVRVVTLDVVIKENDEHFDEIIESGSINVTVGEESKVYPITGQTTHIILDDNVNITTTDELDFKVEFIENEMYLNSTGINNTTGETITKFNARPLNSNLTILVSPNPQNITNNVTITGQVIDELGEIVEEGTITIEVDGKEPDTFSFAGGSYEYNFTTDTAGNIKFNLTFNGQKTSQGSVLIVEGKNSSVFTVDKLPTITNVELLNSSYNNVTIRVNVTSIFDEDKFVTTGLVDVYDFINSQYLKQGVDVSGKSVDLILPLEPGTNKIIVYYHENEKYLESNAINESAVIFDREICVINVDKLPSITNIEKIVSNKSGEVTLRINVTNTTQDLIETGHVVIVDATNGDILGEGDLNKGKVDILLGTVTQPGDILVNITYQGNDYYLSSNAPGNTPGLENTTTLTVTTDPSITISLDKSEVVIGNQVRISGIVLNETAQPVTGGSVNVTIDDQKFKAYLDTQTGEYYYVYTPKANGTYTINASYIKDDEVIVTSSDVELLVNKINSTTSIIVLNNTAGNVTLEVSVAGVDGNKTMTGEVSITINGNIITPLELTGQESYIVPLSDSTVQSGPVTIIVTFNENENYYSSMDTKEIIVANQTPILNVDVVEKTVINSTVATIIGNLSDDLGNNISDNYVEIFIDGVSVGFAKTNTTGGFTFEYTADKLGEIIVNVTYYGDNIRYAKQSNTTKFNVIKLNTAVLLNVSDITYTEFEVINFTINETDATGRVTVEVTSDVEGFTPIVAYGEFNGDILLLPLYGLEAGEYTVTVTYDGDGMYNGNATTKSFTVEKLSDYPISVTALNITYKDEGVVFVILPSDAKGTVTVNVTGRDPEEINLEETNMLIIPAGELDAGDYEVNISYVDDNYALKTNSTTFNVAQLPSTITVDVVSPVKVGNKTTISGTLMDKTNAPIANATVVIQVDKKNVGSVTTNPDGTYTFNYTGSVVGTHNVSSIYGGNNTFIGTNATSSFEVVKLDTSITIDELSEVTLGDNVVITGRLTDENNKAVNKGDITVGFGDVSKTVQTDKNGNYNVDFPSTAVGKEIITAVYEGNETYNGADTFSTVNIVKKDATITVDDIDEPKAYNPLNVSGSIKDGDGNGVAGIPVIVTVNGKEYPATTDSDGNYEVEADNIEEGENTVSVTSGNDVYAIEPVTSKFNADLKDAKASISDVPDAKMGDNVTISGKIVDEKGNPVQNVKVSVKVNDKVYNVTTDKDGKYKLENPEIVVGSNNVTVKAEDDKYKATTSKASFNVTKHTSKLIVDSVIGTIGEDITLVARVVDEKGNPVSGGNLVFKLNGKTLKVDGRFDSDAAPLKLKVVDGIVKYTMKADSYLRAGKNITASYSGSYMYESAKGNVAEANIRKRTAQVKVTVTPTRAKQDSQIVLTATLKDVSPNATNKTCITTGGDVIFKVNGVTIKDVKGNVKRINATSTVVNYAYTVPTGMGGMDANGIKNYTVEAVYNNSMFYPNARNSSSFYVQRSIVVINFIKTTVKNNVLSIKANFTDYENKYLIGDNKVCVKINGKTYQENGKTKYFTVTNGKVNLSGIKLASGTKVKSVTLVTGEREAYEGARATTENITTS
jgi:hypothetical protein